MQEKFACACSIKHLVVVIAILFWTGIVSAQTSSFTYQGRLTDGGTAASGNYDLQFALFDSLSGGAQVGSTQTLNTVAVSSGVFTVSLDFGASAFNGANRFLEISARPAGSGTFTLLSPRQQITSTPYAVRSLNATTADSVPASGVPSGSSNYIQNSTSQQATSNFHISGNGTAGGTLSGSIVNATTQYNLGGNRVFSVSGVGSFVNSNTFAGVGAGTANTPDSSGFGSSNSFYGKDAGLRNTTGFGNSFFGVSAGFNNTTAVENSFFGGGAGRSTTTGGENSFFGDFAGLSNTTGRDNAFFGYHSGQFNTTGNANAFFGDQVAPNSNGDSNSFFGSQAAAFNFGGSRNAFFGSLAGSSNSGGSNNTIVGFSANVGSGNLTNASALGSQAQVDASNSLVLGSIKNVNGATADTNVGIGTTTPQRKLNIKGAGADGFGVGDLLVTSTGDIGAAITLESTGFGGRKFSWISTSSGADPGAGALAVFDPGASAYRMVINSFGQVGIGPSAPLDKLHVSGDIRVGTIGTNGCLKNNNGGTITGTCSSDARFKRDIRPFPNLLNRVTQLQPVHFYWRASEFPEKGFGEAQSYGLVAQDVERALPELVSDDAEGFKQVDYSKLPLLLLQAIKEQQTQIQQQQKLIERQQALAVRQQQQLNALKRLACRSHRRAGVCQ